jgi:hypothetical protein
MKKASKKTCLCGCGAEVRRTFLSGHDAKLKSARTARTKAQREWLRAQGVRP